MDRFKPVTETGTDTKVIQSDAAATDINRLVAEMTHGGAAPRLNPREGVFADVSDATDLRQHLDIARSANELFMTLPASVRFACENDVVRFVEMLSNDPQALIDAGLALEGQGDDSGVSETPETPSPEAPAPSEAPVSGEV